MVQFSVLCQRICLTIAASGPDPPPPQLLQSVVFRLTSLQQLHKTHGVCLVAVDEAHCVSEWGHDFRPDYRTISVVRKYLPGAPILAVTATATDTVCQDIICNLELNSPLVTKLSFDRPNLFYEVRSKVRTRAFVHVSYAAAVVDNAPTKFVRCLSRRAFRKICSQSAKTTSSGASQCSCIASRFMKLSRLRSICKLTASQCVHGSVLVLFVSDGVNVHM